MLLALQTLVTYVRARLDEERGATMVEYGLMVALIAVVVTAGAFLLGGAVNTLFNDTATCVGTGGPC